MFTSHERRMTQRDLASLSQIILKATFQAQSAVLGMNGRQCRMDIRAMRVGHTRSWPFMAAGMRSRGRAVEPDGVRTFGRSEKCGGEES